MNDKPFPESSKEILKDTIENIKSHSKNKAIKLKAKKKSKEDIVYIINYYSHFYNIKEPTFSLNKKGQNKVQKVYNNNTRII